MKLAIKKIRWDRISLSNLYVLSFVLTMIFILFVKNKIINQVSLFSESSLHTIQEYLDTERPVFLFLLRERLVPILSLFLMSTTSFGNVYVYLHIVWYGISSGLFLAIVLLRYGLKGILLLVAGMFPHYLIYIPVLILTMHMTREKRIVNGKYYGQMIVIILVVIISCILECYVNPEVVAKILKVF